MKSNFTIDRLEDRNLLAAIAYNATTDLVTFTADAGEVDIVTVSAPTATSLQIQVGNGDAIALTDDASGNADFVLSTNTVANDTLTIDVSSSAVDQLTTLLNDLSDMFTVTGLAGTSTLFVLGGQGDDVIDASAIATGVNLTGQSGNDTLTGGSGDDVLNGGAGLDVIVGNDGNDTNSFSDQATGVVATVAADGSGTANDGTDSETFTGIENLTGSDFNDVLTATGSAANTLLGRDGDDVLAGGGGLDVINGGDGIDTNSFAGIGLGVTATIAADGSGTAAYGAISESFVSIENLTGSDQADTLTGNDSVNHIDGGSGDDVISGAGGDDMLFGGSGDDEINGGDGNDRITGGFGSDTLNGDAGDDMLMGGGQIEITVTNLGAADGSLLTPVFLATQNGVYDFFDNGSPASASLESLAEDGNVGPRIDVALASGGVGQAFATAGGPLAPGESRTVSFYADPADPLTQYLSYASMVIPSNDAFIGNDDPMQVGLFDANGGLIQRTGTGKFIVAGSDVWDAGTEVNDEIPANTAGLAQAAPNTGVTEGGNVVPHAGFIVGGNVLTAKPGSDFTAAGAQIMGIEVSAAMNEQGFGVSFVDQTVTPLSAQSAADIIAEAEEDALYINIHTTSVGSGEIRGQLELQTDTTVDGVRTLVLTANLDSAQEPGGSSSSDATGTATVTIVDDGTTVLYSATLDVLGIMAGDLMPVAGVSSIHIHNAEFGSNGAVVLDLVQDAGGDVSGATSDGSVFQTSVEADNDILNGGTGADMLSGGEGADELFGGDGVDVLFGGAGDDLLEGGDGDDTLNGNDGNDILRGADGNDKNFGGDGNDAINGGEGDDELWGQGGDDFLIGLGGTDIVKGGDGVDTNSFQNAPTAVTATILADGSGTASYATVTETFDGIENLTGSENDDVFVAEGIADNVFRGLGGNDSLNGGGGADTILGNDGDDTLVGNDGDDIVFGGEGNDSLNGGGGDDFLNGENGDDFIVGIGGRDTVVGGDGVDINSFQGIENGVTAFINDAGSGTVQHGLFNEIFIGIERLIGSESDDVLRVFGTTGRLIQGLGGNDLIIGGSGIDQIFGGDGDDTIRGRAGADVLLGGLGNDTINGDAGADFIRGDEGNDILSGDAGDDRVLGSAGLDSLFGNDGEDLLFGGLDADNLFGGLGDDALLGEEGDDVLIGGLGDDDLIGGDGNNTEIQ